MTRSRGAELTGSSLIMMISSPGNSLLSEGPPTCKQTIVLEQQSSNASLQQSERGLHPGVHAILYHFTVLHIIQQRQTSNIWQTSDHCRWTVDVLLHLAWQSGPQPASRFPPQSRIRGQGPVSSPPDEVPGEPRPGGPLPGSCSVTLGWNKQDKDPSDEATFTTLRETRCSQTYSTYLRPSTSSGGLWGLSVFLVFFSLMVTKVSWCHNNLCISS